jgi:hypothetical protein
MPERRQLGLIFRDSRIQSRDLRVVRVDLRLDVACRIGMRAAREECEE